MIALTRFDLLVTGESETIVKGELPSESSDPSKSSVGVTLVSQMSSDSAVEAVSLDSLGEAESQAVQILENAINSALDASLIGTLETVTPPSSPSVTRQESETKGEVVVVASGLYSLALCSLSI